MDAKGFPFLLLLFLLLLFLLLSPFLWFYCCKVNPEMMNKPHVSRPAMHSVVIKHLNLG